MLGSKTLKSSILVFLVLMALSPVLRTLSAATSSDSIWALAAVLFGLNAMLADYTPARLDAHVQERSVIPCIPISRRSNHLITRYDTDTTGYLRSSR
jgi:hypothetical protein